MQNSCRTNNRTNYAFNISSQQCNELSSGQLMNGPANGNAEARAFDQTSSSGSGAQPPKKVLPANGKKTKGRVKIKMEFIDNKLRRYTTFSKRKTGIMKKAYELSTLTGTQVMLLVASETGHVYTFATRKLQPMITSEAGKALIQTCLNSPDPPPGPGSSNLDQRMSATGFEETDLTYSVGDDCDKILEGKYSSPSSPQSETGSPPQLMSRSPSPHVVDADRAANGQQQLLTGNTGFATILTTTPGGTLTPATVQIGGFHAGGENALSAADTGNSGGGGSSVFRFPGQSSGQSFSLAISGTNKNAVSSSSVSSVTNQSPIAVVQNAQQNLSLVSGNVVIPAAQTLLRAGSNSSNVSNSGNNSVQGAFMYHAAQGLVYTAPSNMSEGVIVNLGQEQGGTQQYITIPVSLSLTPAQQQQLMQVAPITVTASSSSQITGCTPAKRERLRK